MPAFYSFSRAGTVSEKTWVTKREWQGFTYKWRILDINGGEIDPKSAQVFSTELCLWESGCLSSSTVQLPSSRKASAWSHPSVFCSPIFKRRHTYPSSSQELQLHSLPKSLCSSLLQICIGSLLILQVIVQDHEITSIWGSNGVVLHKDLSWCSKTSSLNKQKADKEGQLSPLPRLPHSWSQYAHPDCMVPGEAGQSICRCIKSLSLLDLTKNWKNKCDK